MDEPPELLAEYVPPHDGFDELLGSNGAPRPAWAEFMKELDTLGLASMAHRWKEAEQLIHENGVSYNAYGDAEGLQRPWVLSPLPILVGPRDWIKLAGGIAQRARLLNALLTDIYGPQRCISQGALPADLLFAHPGFLTPIHGLMVPNGNWLPFYAADVIREPSGSFCVIEDCTQAPSGPGYALENRVVLSTVLPEVFRACHVERLAPFFRAMRECIRALAPHNRDNPRIVILTPGPYHSTYFEQAYLAQYLGFTLVSGDDLAVRDERLYIKTLGGLQPVDVVWRRVNDDYCDPLELRPESALGVPGLVQAVRTGNVAMVSPLGSGVLQTPAIMPYLPALCRQLLGEDLQLPSLPSYWLGDKRAFQAAMPRLASLIVKAAYGSSSSQPIDAAKLAASELEQLREAITARPREYVAQERVTPSTTPIITHGRLTPGRFTLRNFAVCQRSEDYWVLPGALAKVADSNADFTALQQLGARTKDVWVVSDESVATYAPAVASTQPVVRLSRGGGDLASRVADNLYWLGRYTERAEGIARLTRVLASRTSDIASQADINHRTEFSPLLGALEAQTQFIYVGETELRAVPELKVIEEQLRLALCDEQCQGALVAVITSALRTARVVRDRISLDTWRVLASLEEQVEALRQLWESQPLSAMASILNDVVITLAGFSGLVMESMSRGHAWRFLDMGRRLERATAVVILVRATLGQSSTREGPLLETVLDIADSGITYRRRYLSNLQVAPVLDLLMMDPCNPRSVIYQLQALATHIEALPPLPDTDVSSPQRRLLLRASTQLELADLKELCTLDTAGARPALKQLLRHLGTTLPELSDSLSNTYLNHAHVSRHLANDLPIAVRPGRPEGSA